MPNPIIAINRVLKAHGITSRWTKGMIANQLLSELYECFNKETQEKYFKPVEERKD